jgi:hypothetical protein
MAADPSTFFLNASIRSPAEVLAMLQAPGAPSLTGGQASSVQALLDGKFEANIATAQKTADAQNQKIMQATGAAMLAVGTQTGAVPLQVAGVVVELFSLVAAPFAKFMDSLTLHFGPTGIQCHSVDWPAALYYSADAMAWPAGAQNVNPRPKPLANGLNQLPPGSLAALVIPPLCKTFADLENCQQPGCIGCPDGGGYANPTSMAPFAPSSNVLIAMLVNLWNKGAVGDWIDYFVPFVPSGPYVAIGWPGWNGGGVVQNTTSLAIAAGGWFPLPPPFILPLQARYAFQPLSSVPANVADPSLEYQPWPAGTSPTDPHIDPYSGGKPGFQWSRIRAKTGPFVAGSIGEKVIVGAGAAAGLSVAAALVYAWKTGKSLSTVIELVGKMVPEV